MQNNVVVALCATLLLLSAAPLAAQQTPKQTSAPDEAGMSAEAYRLLEIGLNANGLMGANIKPWHIKIDFQMSAGTRHPNEVSKLVNGSMEEWFRGPYQWRRSYTSAEPEWNGSEWSSSKVERYAKKDRREELQDYLLMKRIARPLIDPLFQNANLKPAEQLVINQMDRANITLHCVSLSEGARAKRGKFPEWQVPTWCFDSDQHLRLLRSEQTYLEFDDIQVFQGRAVARDIKITTNGRLQDAIKVTLLEQTDTIDEALLKPPDNAVFRPYVIDLGLPKPVSSYEEGAHIPLVPGGDMLHTFLVPVFIHTDGSVQLQRGAGDSGSLTPVVEAVYKAVAKWKFKPYLVDGQPAEVAYYVSYPLDLKPFVPSYDRPPVSPPDDVAGDYPM